MSAIDRQVGGAVLQPIFFVLGRVLDTCMEITFASPRLHLPAASSLWEGSSFAHTHIPLETQCRIKAILFHWKFHNTQIYDTLWIQSRKAASNREVIINKWRGSTVHCKEKKIWRKAQDDYLNPIPGEEDT